MKSPRRLLILTTIAIIISSCQSASISKYIPATVSPESCASSDGPLPSLSNIKLPSTAHPVYSSLGGGLVQSKEFTIELLLYCDAFFQSNATETNYQSDIDGLAIYYNWRFDAPFKNEKAFTYFGMEPNVQLRLVSYTQGYMSQGQLTGVHLLGSNSISDFSKKSSLRFVYIAQGTFGELAGAALSFDLQQVSDGLQPSNILVAPLSDIELQSTKNVLPTVVP